MNFRGMQDPHATQLLFIRANPTYTIETGMVGLHLPRSGAASGTANQIGATSAAVAKAVGLPMLQQNQDPFSGFLRGPIFWPQKL